MSDGRKIADESSEDDWAMSETKPSADDRESDSESGSLSPSDLYDPPDTGDLREWDEDAESGQKPKHQNPVPFRDPGHDAGRATAARLEPETNSILVVHPESPPEEGWEMQHMIPGDDWKMPEPEYTSSVGRTFAKESKSEIVDPNLAEMYLPPGGEESESDEDEAELEEFDSEIVPEEPEMVEADEPKSSPAAAAAPAAALFLFIGLMGLVLALLLTLVAAYLYYS